VTTTLREPDTLPDDPTGDDPTSEPEARTGMRSSLVWLIALGSYLPLAALGYLPVWVHWSSQLNGCNCWDQILLEWFVNWTPAAIGHGHSVLATNFIDAPGGVNVMWNTSVLALGTLASPLTETIGVVHTFVILLTLSVALSASTMFVLLRRWTSWLPAAWLGGLVYGFSTFAITESNQGRLTFVFVAIPPLIVLVLDKLIKKEWSPLLGGAVLGVLVAGQLFVSEELLTISGLLLVLILVPLAAFHWSEVFRRRMEIVWAAVAAGVSFLVCAGYPLFVQFTGPDRITGPPQTHAQEALFSSDLSSLVIPSITQWWDYAWTNQISEAFTAAGAAEITEYVGIPLLLVLLATVVLRHRRTVVKIFASVALLSFLFSMGPRLIVENHRTVIRGPYDVLAHLPVLGDIIPSRFALGFWFAVGILFAVGLQDGYDWTTRTVTKRLRAWKEPGTRAQATRQRRTAVRGAAVAVALIGVGVVIPMVPDWPSQQLPADVPAFFTSPDVRTVAPNSLAVTYPYPLTSMAQPMLWQANAGMRFRMLGGYAIAPGADGTGTFFPDTNPFIYCFLRIYTSASTKECDPTQLAQTLHHLGVTSIIAGDTQPNVGVARSVVTQTVGAAPRHVGGVWLWQCTSRRAGAACSWS
jgi:hypothetical protein